MEKLSFIKENLPNILVVDDEDRVFSLLRELLSENYNLDYATTLTDALAKLRNFDYEAALVDINLPDINGIEFIKKCKQLAIDIQIIFITGSADIKDAVRLVKEGAYDYLTKPFDFNILKESLAGAVQRQRTNSRNKVFNKDYKIIKKIASGSFGIVFLVEKDSNYYAMKILKVEKDIDMWKKDIKRFKMEAEIISRIDHPCIIKLYHYNFDEQNGAPYIIMEYVRGKTLSQLIREGSLHFADKLSIIRQIADVLALLHEKGIIHRDIKPDNIIVDAAGCAKITDFGISHIVSGSHAFTDDITGSPLYMSPESFDKNRSAGPESDIFSLGVLSYELITGIRPFGGENIPQIISEVCTKLPLQPSKIVPDIPLWVEDLLAKMLAKEPSERVDAPGVVKWIDHYVGESSKPAVATITTKILRAMLFVKREWS